MTITTQKCVVPGDVPLGSSIGLQSVDVLSQRHFSSLGDLETCDWVVRLRRDQGAESTQGPDE